MTLREYAALDQSPDILMHHGILGMKWGIRRTPAQLGHPTPKPRKLASGKTGDYKNDGETVKQTYGKNKTKLVQSRNNSSVSNSSSKSRSDSKPKSKLETVAKKTATSIEKAPSNHRERLINSYMRNKGMSQKEAEAAADKRIKTEKRVAIGAGVAIGAAVTYVAARHYISENVDQVLKEGSTMQRIARPDENTKLQEGRALYLAWGKRDSQRYAGKLGASLMAQQDSAGDINKIKYGAKNALKIASPKSSRQAFSELMDKDPEFKKFVESKALDLRKLGVATFGKQSVMFNKAARSIESGKISKGSGLKSTYDGFNALLVDHSPESQKQINKFYNHLKSKGYAGIADINDRKYSGYNAKTASVIFDTSKLAVNKVSKMNSEQVLSSFKRENLKDWGKVAGTLGVQVGAAVGLSKANKTFTRNAIVNQYVKEHPNTKLTNKEIIDNFNAAHGTKIK